MRATHFTPWLLPLLLVGCGEPQADIHQDTRGPHDPIEEESQDEHQDPQDEDERDDQDPGENTDHGPDSVDLASWVQSGDDFIEGTIAEVQVAWSPLMGHSQGGWQPIAEDDCTAAQPALDLVLTDLTSAHGNTLPSSLTVRLGYLTWTLDGISRPEVRIGEPDPYQWSSATPAFSVGMRVGGPTYQVSDHPDPFFPTGRGQPIYRIVADTAEVIYPGPSDGLQQPEPTLASLDGLSSADLWPQVLAAATAPVASAAAEYREYILATQTLAPELVWSSACQTQVIPEDPCAGDTGNCTP